MDSEQPKPSVEIRVKKPESVRLEFPSLKRWIKYAPQMQANSQIHYAPEIGVQTEASASPKYVLTDYRWTVPIEYGFDPSFPHAWRMAVQVAAQKWMAANPNIKIVYNPKQANFGFNGVRWYWFPRGWVNDRNILAQTNRTNDTTINTPCWTSINGSYAIWKTSGPILTYPTKTGGKFTINVNGPFLHEWGAVLGLNESDNPDATMFRYPHENEDTLSQDDIDGINAAYPTE